MPFARCWIDIKATKLTLINCDSPLEWGYCSPMGMQFSRGARDWGIFFNRLMAGLFVNGEWVVLFSANDLGAHNLS